MNNNELVIVNGDTKQVVTTSLKVAEVFEKKHKHVLEAIHKLEDMRAENSAGSMFVKGAYNDIQGKQRPMYYITRDGFAMLGMGFTGEKAIKFKLEFISAFNAMEKTLQQQIHQQSQLPGLTTAQFLLQQAQFMVEQEQRLSQVESRVEQMESSMQQMATERKEAGQLLLSLDTTDSNPMPAITLRDKIRERVNAYSKAHNVDFADVYHYIYHQLYYRYKVSVNNFRLLAGETKLNALERLGHLPKVYDVVCSLPERIK